jgi:hypothetical protein
LLGVEDLIGHIASVLGESRVVTVLLLVSFQYVQSLHSFGTEDETSSVVDDGLFSNFHVHAGVDSGLFHFSVEDIEVVGTIELVFIVV